MDGSTLASRSADMAVRRSVPRGSSRHGSTRGGASAVTGWRSRARSFSLAMILAILFAPLIWKVAINDIDFTARMQTPSWKHPFGTDDLGQDLLARMLYGGRISLAVGLSAMVVAITVGTIIGAIAGMSRRWVGPALMWLTDLFLSLPALPLLLLVIYLFRDSLEGRVRPGGRRVRDDRRRDRRPALDAGRAAGARAVPLAAREGIRRGGARARRDQAAAGGAPHPAERARAGDRRRHDRRRGRHHRGVDAVVPRPRLPARHPDLGPHPLRRQGLSRHRAALGAVSRAPRSS